MERIGQGNGALVNFKLISSLEHDVSMTEKSHLPNTPVKQRFWLFLHSSEARFISSGHLRKIIVSQSDESDLCLLAIRSVSDVFGVG